MPHVICSDCDAMPDFQQLIILSLCTNVFWVNRENGALALSAVMLMLCISTSGLQQRAHTPLHTRSPNCIAEGLSGNAGGTACCFGAPIGIAGDFTLSSAASFHPIHELRILREGRAVLRIPLDLRRASEAIRDVPRCIAAPEYPRCPCR